MFILNIIQQGDSSFFYYFIKNMPKYRTPIMYDQNVLEYFKNDEFYEEITRQLVKLKASFIELRKLVYSQDEDIKRNFAGKFLFGDYLWAMY